MCLVHSVACCLLPLHEIIGAIGNLLQEKENRYNHRGKRRSKDSLALIGLHGWNRDRPNGIVGVLAAINGALFNPIVIVLQLTSMEEDEQ